MSSYELLVYWNYVLGKWLDTDLNLKDIINLYFFYKVLLFIEI